MFHGSIAGRRGGTHIEPTRELLWRHGLVEQQRVAPRDETRHCLDDTPQHEMLKLAACWLDHDDPRPGDSGRAGRPHHAGR